MGKGLERVQERRIRRETRNQRTKTGTNPEIRTEKPRPYREHREEKPRRTLNFDILVIVHHSFDPVFQDRDVEVDQQSHP